MAAMHSDGKQGTLAGLWLEPRRARSQPPAPQQLTEGGDAPTAALSPDPERLGTPSAPWSVARLVAGIRQQLEGDYQDVWVAGEISNCRAAPSGHLYFTLKDGEAQLPVVLFRRQAMLLRFQPRDGLAVLARGRVSVYESRGQLQLIAETLEPRGAGALQLAFEQLKARLLAEGLFDSARKRVLPPFPRTVGVITSTGGAVLHDIVKVVGRRHARLNLLVYPATMQGADCARSVAAGVRWFNQHRDQSSGQNSGQSSGQNSGQSVGKDETQNPPGGWSQVDVILIARGGGSIEDLAGFNDEALARVIRASELPVVSAIGHETDFTIADFVADLRAPTPSAAAEMITAAQHRIEERVQAVDARLRRAIRYQLMLSRQRLTAVSIGEMSNRLLTLVGRRSQRLDDLSHRLDRAITRNFTSRASRVANLTARVERRNPALQLAASRRRLERATGALDRVALAALSESARRLDRVSNRLLALSPLAVLSRGYAIVYGADGLALRSAEETRPGEMIRARLSEGWVRAEVESVERT